MNLFTDLLGLLPLAMAPAASRRTKSITDNDCYAIVQMLQFESKLNDGKLPRGYRQRLADYYYRVLTRSIDTIIHNWKMGKSTKSQYQKAG